MTQRVSRMINLGKEDGTSMNINETKLLLRDIVLASDVPLRLKARALTVLTGIPTDEVESVTCLNGRFEVSARDIQEMQKHRDRIRQIKYLRDTYGWSLKDSKDVVFYLHDHRILGKIGSVGG